MSETKSAQRRENRLAYRTWVDSAGIREGSPLRTLSQSISDDKLKRFENLITKKDYSSHIAMDTLVSVIWDREEYSTSDVEKITSAANFSLSKNHGKDEFYVTMIALHNLPPAGEVSKKSNLLISLCFQDVSRLAEADFTDKTKISSFVNGHFRAIEHAYAAEGMAGPATLQARKLMLLDLSGFADHNPGIGDLATFLPPPGRKGQLASKEELYALHTVTEACKAFAEQEQPASRPVGRMMRRLKSALGVQKAVIGQEVRAAIAELREKNPVTATSTLTESLGV